jgi:hypothetical protein
VDEEVEEKVNGEIGENVKREVEKYEIIKFSRTQKDDDKDEVQLEVKAGVKEEVEVQV